MCKTWVFRVAVLAGLISHSAAAQLAVTNNTSATALAHALLDPCGIEFDSATANIATDIHGHAGAGIFTIGSSPNTYGLLLAGSTGGGVVLSSGNAADYLTGPNTAIQHSVAYNLGATPAEKALMQPLTGTTALRDVSHLSITITVATATTLHFAFVYGTEEFPEYVNSQWCDAFGIFVNGINVALPGGSSANVNNPCMAWITGTELDGVVNCGNQAVQVAAATLTPGTNTLEFIIADASDEILDSTAFIRCYCDWTTPPQFTLQPVSIEVPCKSSFTQHVEAEGDCGVTYTWEVVSCPGSSGGGYSVSDTPGIVSGSQTNMLQFTPAGVLAYAGCVLRARANGPSLSTLSDPFTISVAHPSITQQPVDTFGCPPDPMSFTVASGDPGVTYQWFKQCPGGAPVAIQSATGPILDSNAPAYWAPRNEDCGCEVFCRVSHPNCGHTDSNHAKIICCECATPPANMALWMTFDETSGGTCGNAVSPFNGVCYPISSGPSPSPYGYSSSCRFFDGVDDAVRVNHHALIDITTGDFSADAWVYREGGDNSAVQILSKINYNVSLAGWSLLVINNQLAFEMSDGPSTGTMWVTTGAVGAVPMGVWKHVAVTVDRDDPQGGVLYVNGAVAMTFDPTLVPGSLSNNAPLLMGMNHSGMNLLHGYLDEVEIFRRALIGQEVASIYNAKGVGKCKQYCQVVQPVYFCDTSVGTNVGAYFFNHTPAMQPIAPSMTWSPTPATCYPGPWLPAEAIAPISPSIVSAYSTSYISAYAPKPSGMTTPFASACFDVLFMTGPGRAVECSGSVQDRPDMSCNSWCWTCPIVAPIDGSIHVSMPTGTQTKSNVDVPYQAVARAASGGVNPSVALGKLPPGTPLTGVISVRAGTEGTVEFSVRFAEVDALTAGTLELWLDADHDGNFELAASAPLLCHVPGPSADLNGDRVVNGADLGMLLSMWGTAGESPADLVVDHMVDGADLGQLLAQWTN